MALVSTDDGVVASVVTTVGMFFSLVSWKLELCMTCVAAYLNLPRNIESLSAHSLRTFYHSLSSLRNFKTRL